MGVDRTDYIVYGWKLPYGVDKSLDLWDDKFLPYIEGHQGIEYCIINDGMSGKYTVFGKRIAMADEYVGWDFVELNAYFTTEDEEALRLKYLEVFGFGIPEDPKLLVFSHFS